MRLFVALDLDDAVRERIRYFMSDMRSLARNVRWVATESLHVTLKFIGEQPESKLQEFQTALSRVAGEEFELTFRDCGFFPNPKSARVFWVGIEAGPELSKLAGDIDSSLSDVGIEKEKRAFSPHLTLARARGGSGAPGRQGTDHANRDFAGIQKRLANLQVPEFGTMTAREFYLYRSQLSNQGSLYTRLARLPLLGPD
jgi:2'-5' RNA ligase